MRDFQVQRLAGRLDTGHAAPPGRDGDPIRGIIYDVPVDSPGAFCTISYFWGVPPGGAAEQAYLEVDPKGRIPLQSPLNVDLRALRVKGADIALWADAVCINQHDFAQEGAADPPRVTLMCGSRPELEWNVVFDALIACDRELNAEKGVPDPDPDPDLDPEDARLLLLLHGRPAYALGRARKRYQCGMSFWAACTAGADSSYSPLRDLAGHENTGENTPINEAITTFHFCSLRLTLFDLTHAVYIPQSSEKKPLYRRALSMLPYLGDRDFLPP